MLMPRRCLLVALLAAALAPPNFAWAQGGYRIIDLGDFDPWSINESGEIAGTFYYLGSSAAIWRDGRFEQIDSLGGTLTHSRGINETGVVVGYGNTASVPGMFGFIWDGATVPLLPGFRRNNDALAINDQGDIVGGLHGFGHSFAYLWRNGQVTILGTLSGQGISSAMAINNRGQIVGRSSAGDEVASLSHGFLWENGVMTNLSLVRDLNSAGYDINDLGQIVGYVEHPDGSYLAALWDDNGVIDLGTIPGATASEATAINNRSQVVGTAYSSIDHYQAFYWANGVIRPLEALLPTDSGWTFDLAHDINDAGQIIGNGVFQGQQRSFLLTPVEPADLDADGLVNTIDLGTLLSSWSIPATAPGCGGSKICPADINGDGFVNSLDLGMLLAEWMQ